MSEETNGLSALKDAWAGVVETSERVTALSASVRDIPKAARPESLDLEASHRVVLAQSNAVMALRGLLEEFRERRDRQGAVPGA